MLEDALRDMFAGQVQSSPPLDDPAQAVIHRARNIRRRRGMAAGTAGMLLVVVSLGSAFALRGWYLPAQNGPVGLGQPDTAVPEQAPTEVRAQAAVPPAGIDAETASQHPKAGLFPDGFPALDVRAGDELWTSSGARLRLGGVGDVRQAYRVPAGWVYGGATQVRLLRVDGTSVPLAEVFVDPPVDPGPATDGQPGWLLSPDGTRLAFTGKQTLTVATISDGGLLVRQSTEVAGGAVPVAFYGKSLVIGGTAGGRFGVWQPGQNAAPTWSTAVTHVYGAYGGMLFGTAPDQDDPARSCVVLIEWTGKGLQPIRSDGCALARASSAGDGLASPDGRWLAEPLDDAELVTPSPPAEKAGLADGTGSGRSAGPDTDRGQGGQPDRDAGLTGNQIRLVDLPAVSKGGTSQTRTCALPDTAAPTWADPTTLVAGDASQLVSCSVSGEQRRYAAPEALPDGWQFVASLGDDTPGR